MTNQQNDSAIAVEIALRSAQIAKSALDMMSRRDVMVLRLQFAQVVEHCREMDTYLKKLEKNA